MNARVATLFLGLLGALAAAACNSSPDVSRLQGTWLETDTGRGFRLDDTGHGFGPMCVSTPCKPFGGTPWTLVVHFNALDEIFIQYDEDNPSGNGRLIPCGPCTLTDDDRHLTCRQQTVNGGFLACEFDKVGASTPTP